MNNDRQLNRSGFTLVEVAVVIFIMGIFVSFASTMLRNIGVSNKLRDAREKVTTTSDAVQALTVKTRVLPIALSEIGNPVDFWNKGFKYYPYTPVAGAVTDICRRSSTDLAVCAGDPSVAASPFKCTGNVIKDIAYVIISGGDNLLPEKSELITNANGCLAGYKCVPIYEVSSNFDDLYKYVTLQELKKTVGCIEADSGLRILNTELPYAHETASYSTIIQAEGGVMFTGANKYKWCVNGAPPPDLVYSPATQCTDPAGPTAAPSFNITRATTVNPLLGTTSTPSVTVSVWDANNVKVDKTFVLTIVNP